MYIVRDIFHLKFGHFKDAKALMEESSKIGMMPEAQKGRVLSDFTGDAYRLILEQSFSTLAEYEQMMAGGMAKPEWQQWYTRFKEHVNSSHREILRQVM